MGKKRYRVAQWGTGHSGRHALRKVIEHPQFDLVAVRVYSEDKAGKDAGALCGMEKTGVTATNKTADILAARPDCLLYMPLTDAFSIDDVCTILEAGINIVTLVADQFHHFNSFEPDIKRRLELACERGGASIYAAGPSPGFVQEYLGLGVTSLQRRLDSFTVSEYANMAGRSTPSMMAWLFGWDPSERDGGVSGMAEHMRLDYGASFRQLADDLNIPLDNLTAEGGVALATRDTEIATMSIRKGTVAAQRFEITGWRDGRPLMKQINTWYVTRDIDQPWELRETGWHVVVEGDAPLDISIAFARENYHEVSPGYNAHICVNAIPNVVEARSGLLQTMDMPPIAAQFA